DRGGGQYRLPVGPGWWSPADRPRSSWRPRSPGWRGCPATECSPAATCCSWSPWSRRRGRVVSGDTGVAHLATALRTPSVVLFGPVSPRLWGPPEDARHLVLWAGRTGDPHAGSPDAGLLEITPEQVLQALLAAGGQLAGGLTGIRLSLPRRSAGACR